MVIKAVNYYEDIELTTKVQVLDKNYQWENIKSRLDKMTVAPKQLFPHLQKK